MSATTDLRPSPIAGVWYPGDATRLGASMDHLLHQAHPPELTGELVGLIAPHAGHRYSGLTAAHAFRCVMGKSYDTVVIASPLHGYFPAPLTTTAHRAYQTPLGPVWVDTEAVKALNAALDKRHIHALVALPHDNEHAQEIELPFLQRALSGDFKLLPIMVRTLEPHLLQSLGEALAEICSGKNYLLVASTDLSHFYPEDIANQLDSEMLRQMAALSPEGVLEAETSGLGAACGAGAVAAILWAAHSLGANSAQILHRSNSGNETGDHTSVVGYGAVALVKTL